MSNQENDESWIAIDFDGTMAEYHGWVKWNSFGKPIPAMIERIKQWLSEGKEVRIFTARVGVRDSHIGVCKVSGEEFTTHQMRNALAMWCVEHIGVQLHATCVKDLHMTELWDDRAVGVQANTGLTLVEAAVAEYNALQGKAFQS